MINFIKEHSMEFISVIVVVLFLICVNFVINNIKSEVQDKNLVKEATKVYLEVKEDVDEAIEEYNDDK